MNMNGKESPLSVSSLPYSNLAGLSNSEAQQALTLLADTALSRQQELLQYSADPANDNNDENDSDSPIMDTFYNPGDSGQLER